MSWENRNILVGVAGGIAAYKVAGLVSTLVQAGAEVQVVMTEAATRFIGPVTFRSLSGRPVVTSAFDEQPFPESPHVGVARWAELAILAPATADLIARLATGLTDDPVSLVTCALPQSTPVVLAPAMNADMWANPVVQRNCGTLTEELGYHLVGPDDGWQACRTDGSGRMSEPDSIINAAAAHLPD
ncbi:MAG: flavoprotein [Phycisphaeraceae bacterium]|nr:flavoprotein [Phycisphaeraceae bacterium]